MDEFTDIFIDVLIDAFTDVFIDVFIDVFRDVCVHKLAYTHAGHSQGYLICWLHAYACQSP